MELLAIFVNNIAPILAVAGVGFLLSRYLQLDARTLSRVTLYALTPCLIFDLLVGSPVSAAEFGQLIVFTIGTTLGVGAIAWLVTRTLRIERVLASATLLVVMFSNGGNYGMPLAMFAFGQAAMARASIYFVISVILTYTLGIVVASSGHRSLRAALAGVFKIPTVYAAVAALVVMVTGIRLPPAVMRPIELLSTASVPVMLLVLGMQLGQVGRLEKLPLVGLVVGLRLVVSALIGLGLAQVIGLAGAARQAGILQTAMPVAVVTTILAVEFQIEPTFVTSTVLLSTLLSPLTLTPLIALLR
jgi:predicted permease